MSQNLPFMVYHILKKFDPDKKGFMPKSRFYKAAYIIHKRLVKRGIETGLPWSWYIYGPEVQMDFVPAECYHIEEGELGEGSKVFFGELPFSQLPIKDEKAMLYEIERLEKEKPSTATLVEEVYTAPPRKVLRLFKEYEDLMLSLKEKETKLNIATQKNVLQHLNQIEKTYSEKEFGGMLDDYQRLDALMRFLCVRDVELLKEKLDLVHDFRVILATKASALFNENLPEEWMNSRHSLAYERLKAFRPTLDKAEAELYAKLHISDKKMHKYVKPLMKAAQDVSKEV